MTQGKAASGRGADGDEGCALVDLVALGDVDGQDGAVAGGAYLVFHFHGREDDQALAGPDRVALLDRHADDLARHRRLDDRFAGHGGRLSLYVRQAALPLVLDDDPEELAADDDLD